LREPTLAFRHICSPCLTVSSFSCLSLGGQSKGLCGWESMTICGIFSNRGITPGSASFFVWCNAAGYDSSYI
jgi:hypothetical protein